MSSQGRVGYLGIDFGNDNCCVYAYHNRDAHIVTYYEDRLIPSFVSFCFNERSIGTNAKHQSINSLSGTVHGIKRKLVRDNVDKKRITRVWHGGEFRQLIPEQLAAMIFSKIKCWAVKKLKLDQVKCVISVPNYFGQRERKSLLLAAEVAELNVERLITDTAATCITYVWDMDISVDRVVAFVDMGENGLQVSMCRLHGEHAKVLAVETAPELGGKSFDNMLAKHFWGKYSEVFPILDKYSIDEKKRAHFRVLDAVEKVKRKLCSSNTRFPLEVEPFVGTENLHYDMCYADMEALCGDIIAKATTVMKMCLVKSGLTAKDIHSVETIGGSCRVPAIRNAIFEVFGKHPSVTVNLSEGVARGCAIQCAAMNFFNILKSCIVEDVLYHRIDIHMNQVHIETIGEGTPTPFTKEYKALFEAAEKPSSVCIEATHTTSHGPQYTVGKWMINEFMEETKHGENVISFKIIIKIDKNGLLDISGEGVHMVKPALAPPASLEDMKATESLFKTIDREAEEKAFARNSLEKYIFDKQSECSHKKGALSYVDLEGILNTLKESDNWMAKDYQRQLYQLKSLYGEKETEEMDCTA